MTPCKNEKKILYDLLGETLSHHFAKFIGNISCRRGDKTFLICYVTSCDYVINGEKFFGREHLALSNHCAKFDAHRSCEVEIKRF